MEFPEKRGKTQTARIMSSSIHLLKTAWKAPLQLKSHCNSTIVLKKSWKMETWTKTTRRKNIRKNGIKRNSHEKYCNTLFVLRPPFELERRVISPDRTRERSVQDLMLSWVYVEVFAYIVFQYLKSVPHISWFILWGLVFCEICACFCFFGNLYPSV